MCAPTMYISWVRAANLRAINFFARAALAGLRIKSAQFLIRLQLRIHIDARGSFDAAIACAAHRPVRPRAGRPAGVRRLVREEGVLEPRDIRAAVAFELRLDPVHRRAVAIRSLAAIAE